MPSASHGMSRTHPKVISTAVFNFLNWHRPVMTGRSAYPQWDATDSRVAVVDRQKSTFKR